MFYVYLLRSQAKPNETYVGLTDNLKLRLQQHNAGKSAHTSKSAPWRLVTYMGFSNKAQAGRFEKYLKNGSGRAFATRHLWDSGE